MKTFGEMILQLKAHSALTEDPRSNPSPFFGQHIASFTSSTRESIILAWPLQALLSCAQTHTQTFACTYN